MIALKKITLLGATSRICQYLIPKLLEHKEFELTLFARNASRRLKHYSSNQRVVLIDGDFKEISKVSQAVKYADFVYLATATDIELNRNILTALKHSKHAKIVIAGVLGIEDELPPKFEQWNSCMLGDIKIYQQAAHVFFDSDIPYLYLRIAWLYNKPISDYILVPSGQPFLGTQVTRLSVAHYIDRIFTSDDIKWYQSIGIVEPNTSGNIPLFIEHCQCF